MVTRRYRPPTPPIRGGTVQGENFKEVKYESCLHDLVKMRLRKVHTRSNAPFSLETTIPEGKKRKRKKARASCVNFFGL
jgi:hypothetical protein